MCSKTRDRETGARPNFSALLGAIAAAANTSEAVLYTDYGSRLIGPPHPGGTSPVSAMQARFAAFQSAISTRVPLPCAVGVHLRVRDGLHNATITPETPVANLTYALSLSPLGTTATMAGLLRMLKKKAAGVNRTGSEVIRLMVPPLKFSPPIATWREARGMEVLMGGAVLIAQRLVASCRVFVGDKVSSVTSTIMRMRAASGLPQGSTHTLRGVLTLG